MGSGHCVNCYSMARTKQTARISTGGQPPRKPLPLIPARQSRVAPAPVPMKTYRYGKVPKVLRRHTRGNVVPDVFPKSFNVVTTVPPKSTDAPVMELVEAFSNVGFETIRKHSGGDEGMELVESLKNMGFN